MKLLSFSSVALAVALTACSKPEPPTFTPKLAKVTQVSLAGVMLDVEVDVKNPNKTDLSARAVTGKLTVDGRYDMGTLSVDHPVTLPAGAETTIDVPVQVAWKDMTALASLGVINRPVPFALDGTATIGGEKINFDVPFHVAGAFSHDEIVKAAQRSVPGVPGFKLPM